MKISTILQVLSIPAWLPQLPVLVSSELHMTIIPSSGEAKAFANRSADPDKIRAILYKYTVHH